MLSFFELFNRGGWVMYVILALSIYTLAMVLRKYWQFGRLKLYQRGFAESVLAQFAGQEAGLSPALVSMLEARMKHHPHPLARVVEGVLQLAAQSSLAPELKREEISRIAQQEMARLESGLKGLELASGLAPLLGLLGTVLGMVTVFSSIESAGARVDASLLAGGIWEALLTTVFGLIVAVAAQIGLHLLSTKLEAVRLEINNVGTQLLPLLFPHKAA